MAEVTAHFLKGNGEIQDGSEICVTLDFGEIDHKEYGKIQNLKGSIPLILKMGEYPTPKWFQLSKEDQKKLLNIFIKKYSHLFEDKETIEMKTLILCTILEITFINPEFDPFSKNFEHSLDILLSSLIADDFVDEEDDLDKIVKPDFQAKFIEILSELKGYNTVGDFTPFDKLAQKVPILEKNIKLIGQTLFDIDKYHPGFYSYLNIFDRLSIDLESGMIIRSKYYQNDPNGPYSPIAAFFLSGFTTAVSAIHFKAYWKNCVLPDYIKNSINYKILENSLKASARLLNELFGLKKDISKSKLHYFENLILKNVVEEGEKLEDAVQFSFKQLKYLIRDIKIAQHQLEITFPKDLKKIKDFCEICNFMFDGTLYSYVSLATQTDHPYGQNFVKVEKMDKKH